MAARQQHGFKYQDNIINTWGLVKEKSYVGEYDGYFVDNNFPVQIKTIKFGSAIDLGDYKRNSTKDKNFILFIGFWKGNNNNVSFENEHILIINSNWWRDLFMAPKELIDKMYTLLHNISNDKSDDVFWKQETKKLISLWKSSWKLYRYSFFYKWGLDYPERLIIPRFKRDHKKQKRIQCSIPNKLFNKYFLNQCVKITT